MVRAFFTVALAAASLSVLATRAPLDFGRIRFRVVTSPIPAKDNSVSVSLPDLSVLAGTPAAIVIRLRGATEPTELALTLDGASIGAVSLAAGQETRVDASTSSLAGPGHHLVVNGDRPQWQLSYLEIANVHGFSRGIIGFDIVPYLNRQFQTLPWWVLVPIGIGLLALRPRPDWPARVAHQRLYQAGVAAVLLLFVAVLTADRFTPFKILLSLKTALLCVAVLYAEGVREAWTWVTRLASAIDARLDPWRATASSMVRAAARPWMPPVLAGAVALSVVVLALTRGATYAGGSDSYGYIAQSELLARGQLYVDQPLVADLPPGVGDSVMTPLGFRPQPDSGVPGRIVPVYSPGLPMLMAGLRLLFGPNGVYLVVPALAGLTVWLTFVLGRDFAGPGTGLFAALWLAASPAFVNSSLTPMSDVPVSAWWMAAFVPALRKGTGLAAVAGIATSLAVLTRPNLAPLAVIVALPYGVRWLRHRSRAHGVDLGMFALTAAVGPAIVAWLFNYWYGSPFLSGYGSSDSLFSWSFVLPNLARYPRWFIESQTPVILAGLAVPFLLRRPGHVARHAPVAMLAWLMLVFAALVWGSYLGYLVFDDWWYLRFLLPSYPPLLALASAALLITLQRTPAPRSFAVALMALLAAHGIYFCLTKDVFNLAVGESRYQRVGEFAARELPDSSLLLSMQHSGSLRYYSHLPTLRYDLMDPDRLDDVVAHFQARGRNVFIVVDEWEEREFRGRFARASALGRLDWAPFAMAPGRMPGAMPVAIYDPRDRSSTTSAAPRIIP
jgi:hypothetical protein